MPTKPKTKPANKENLSMPDISGASIKPDIPDNLAQMNQISKDLTGLLKLTNLNLIDALSNNCECDVCNRTRKSADVIKRIMEAISTE